MVGTRAPIRRKGRGTVKTGRSPRQGRRFEFLPRREPCDKFPEGSNKKLPVSFIVFRDHACAGNRGH